MTWLVPLVGCSAVPADPADLLPPCWTAAPPPNVDVCCRHVCRYPQIPGGHSGFTPDQLRSFTAPTIVIAAENDFYSPGHAVAAAAKLALLGCRRTIVMPGARHLQSRSSVAETNRLVAEFFTEHETAGLGHAKEA